MDWEPVIGLEVHVQLKTKTKMFCSCPADYGAPPNTRICPICMGYPGTLPVVNREAVSQALKVALAMHCTIHEQSGFARKNYFYPDLPKGYQITQYAVPLAEKGYLRIKLNGMEKSIGITRMHLEEDAGKMIHGAGEGSRVDFNRCGIPLLEIVSEPDMASPEEAVAYLEALRLNLLYLGVSDCNLEEGSMRCDANISLRPRGEKTFGTKAELKNLNSFQFLKKALYYEIERQRDILEKGEAVIQETRLFDEKLGKTFSMRSKEEAHDYRYFPEPDLGALVVDQAWIQATKDALPPLPEEIRNRLLEQGFRKDYVEIFLKDPLCVIFVEETRQMIHDPEMIGNMVASDLLGIMRDHHITFETLPLTPGNMAKLLKMVKDNTLSIRTAKELLEELVCHGGDPEVLVEEKGLAQVSDEAVLEDLVRSILQENPQQVQAYRAGKTKLLGFFIGQGMKRTGGKAHPQLLQKLFKQYLDES